MRNLINMVSLFEAYDRSKTLSVYGEKLRDKIDFVERDNRYTVEQALLAFEVADPTPKKAFVLNLIKWYLDGSMRLIEDASKATEPLKLYNQFRLRADVPNINSLSFNDLLDLGDRLSTTKSRTEENKDTEKSFYQTDQAELLINNDEWKVIIPKTEEAAIYFGKNTRWCTSGKTDNYFSYYNNDGPLYIILEKKTNKRWQFHFESEQFMDEKDNRILNSVITKIIRSTGMKTDFLDKNGSLLRILTDPTEEEKLKALKCNGNAIRYILDQSKEMQILAFESGHDPSDIIQLIYRPCEEAQIIAVSQSPDAIARIEKPCEKAQLIAVSKLPTMITKIHNPCEKAQLIAVRANPYFLNSIANATTNTKQMAAIVKDWKAIYDFSNPSDIIKKAASEEKEQQEKYNTNYERLKSQLERHKP